MSKDHFEEFPPELILLIAPLLPVAELNALVLTCRRLCEILRAELESRLTPERAEELLLWASDSKPHIVKKMLAPPHSVHPSPETSWRYSHTALHVAAQAQNTEIAILLLEAGANPAAPWDQMEYQPLHLATENRDLAMMKLLLDHGAPVDGVYGCDGGSETALHNACSMGHVEIIEFLLERGANLEAHGHYGTPLGFAVHYRKLDAVRYLLDRGADATVTVPLFVLLDGGPPRPHYANLLYIALGLRHPFDPSRRRRPSARTPAEWEGLPLSKEQKELMALLLANGASKETAMETIRTYLTPLAKEALHSKEEYLEIIAGMFKEAEDAVPEFEKNVSSLRNMAIASA